VNEGMIDLIKYSRELTAELQNILQYWTEHAIDTVNGGFYGRIENNNTIHAAAPKGLVLNARILWTFSAAYNFT
jgi:mannobiose 2-epimerase